MDYKNTLNLPQTEFPMKADLVAREPERLRKWEAAGLYQRIQAQRAGAQKFILHDGPPFANGDVHIGTALNKILKDIIVKYKTLRGFNTPYVPGWDCHGLPIEFKVTQEMRKAGDTRTEAAGIRTACEAYARKYIEIQRNNAGTLLKQRSLLIGQCAEGRDLDDRQNAIVSRNRNRGQNPWWSISEAGADSHVIRRKIVEHYDLTFQRRLPRDPFARRKTPAAGHGLFTAVAARQNETAIGFMKQVEGSTLWMMLTKMRTGVTHSYQFSAGGKPLGARGDAIGYNPDSYAKPGVPKGKVSEKLNITSKIYDGMKSDYWVYASPGVDPAVPAALMV